MSWNPEQYREKREKVLGRKKQGLSFGSLSIITALVIITGMAWLGLPGVISYFQTRHLDDAIYRLENQSAWPKSLIPAIKEQKGVSGVSLDTHATRLVITFDRRQSGPKEFSNLFKRHDLDASLLNRVNHRQRMTTLAEEKEAEGETS